MNQGTIAKSVTFEGVGVHSGRIARVTVYPAPAGHGVVFKRTDVADKNNIIPALWDRVVPSELCTVISNEDGVSLSTIEHFMAATVGCGVHNLSVEVDGDEMPILDGSSQLFVDAFMDAGIVDQGAKRRVLKVLKEVTFVEGTKKITFKPSELPVLDVTIDFSERAAGHFAFEKSKRRETMINGNFVHNIASARTFCFLKDVEFLQSKGLARGGSTDNAIVIDGAGLYGGGKLRFDDELVSHKLLDLHGDTSGMVDAHFEAEIIAVQPGHAFSNRAVRHLMNTPDAYTIV